MTKSSSCIRRISWIHIILLLVLNITMLSAAKASPETIVSVEPAYAVDPKPGETFLVHINVANVTDLWACEFKLWYNSTLLEALQVDTGPIWKSPFVAVNNLAVPGRVWWGVTSMAEPSFTGSATMATVLFEAVRGGESILHLNETLLGNHQIPSQPIVHTTEDAYVTVFTEIKPTPQIYINPPSSIISALGENTTIEVVVSNTSDLYGYTFWLSYNNTVIDLLEIKVDGLGQVAPSDPSQRVITDESISGTIKLNCNFVQAEGALPFNGNGTMAWITFNGLTAGVSNLTFIQENTRLFDSDGIQILMKPPVDGEVMVLSKIGDYHTHHINDATDDFPNDYTPMIIPMNGSNVMIAPVITCTNLEESVWKPNHHSCKLAQTLLVDDDWSDKNANYTYVFEDWTDYDWNDIVVSLYAETNNLIINAETCLKSREAAWNNPFGVEITPLGAAIEVHWNSTDHPENHIIRLSSGQTTKIELFVESNPYDVAFVTVVILRMYTLTITSTSGGTTDPVPGNHSYEGGAIVSVIAIPDWRSVLDHWELEGADVGNDTSILISMDKDHTLHAVFKEIPAPPPFVGGHAIPIDKPHFLTPKIDLIPRISLAFILFVSVAVIIILINRRNNTQVKDIKDS